MDIVYCQTHQTKPDKEIEQSNAWHGHCLLPYSPNKTKERNRAIERLDMDIVYCQTHQTKPKKGTEQSNAWHGHCLLPDPLDQCDQT